MPLRKVSTIWSPPSNLSVAADSVINNIKLWLSGRWFKVPADFPARHSFPRLCLSYWIPWSHRCVTESPSDLMGVLEGILVSPSPSTHTKSANGIRYEGTQQKVFDPMRLFNARNANFSTFGGVTARLISKKGPLVCFAKKTFKNIVTKFSYYIWGQTWPHKSLNVSIKFDSNEAQV